MAYIGNGPGVASQRVLTTITAVDGQTTFVPSSGYTLGYVDVFLNGVKLVDGTDYTASNGVNIVLTEAAVLNDTVEVLTYFPRGLSDGYTKAEADGRYEPIDTAYTKTESDTRYEPIDTAYTKAESDTRYVEVTDDTKTGNFIINGAMQVWQRGTSYTHDVTDANATALPYATVDRFKATPHSVGNSTAGEYTSTREIYDGKIWLKQGCTTPYNGSSYIVRSTVHFVEAPNNVSPIQGEEVTLSYLFRAKQNGQYSVTVGDHTDANFSIFSFNYTGAGAAQKVSFTFTVPDVTPTNYTALRFYFSYGVPAGHSLLSDESNLNGTFVSTSSMLTRTSDYKWWEVAGDWVAFTEVQLELGDVATPFEYRSYGEELALCQRYFTRSRHVLGSTFNYGYDGLRAVRCVNSNWAMDNLGFNVDMRVHPSLSYSDHTGTLGAVMRSSNGASLSLTLAAKSDGEIRGFSGGNLSSTQVLQFAFTADAEL